MNTDYVFQTDKNESRNIKKLLNHFSTNNITAFHKINFFMRNLHFISFNGTN